VPAEPTAGTQAAAAAQRAQRAPGRREEMVTLALLTAVHQAEAEAEAEVFQAAMTAALALPALMVVIILEVPEAAEAAHKGILQQQVRQGPTVVVVEVVVGIPELTQ
jgi:hypothetical protein